MPDQPDDDLDPDQEPRIVADTATADAALGQVVERITELDRLRSFMAGLLTVQQVVDTVGVGHRTVTRWVSSGRLVPAARIGHAPRFTAAAVQAALADAATDPRTDA